MNKPKQHCFVLKVDGAKSRALAELAILTAFALRNPDGLVFRLRAPRKRKP